MTLLGFNIHISRNRTPAPTPVQRSFSPTDWIRGKDIPNGPVLSNAYEQVVWVYRAINALAEQVANIPFLFSAGERGRENLVTTGPLLDFYARPHPQINRFQYWELRVIWLMLRGECMRIPIFEEPSSSAASLRHSTTPVPAFQHFSVSAFQRFPTSLHHSSTPSLHSAFRTPDSALKHVLILDPSRFRHIIQDNQLVGWQYTGFGPNTPLDSQVFLPEEVWFEKLPNPFDFWRGLSPLYVADLASKTDYAAGAFMRGIMENNGDSGLIVRTQEQLPEEQQNQIIAALNDRKRRAGSADRPLFLNGVTEIINPQLSSADLQFLENRKFSRSEICAAFGVPEEIVASTDHNKYDVMRGARLNFIENRVAPLCARLEAEENLTTIPALAGSAGILAGVGTNVTGWFDLDSLTIMQDARRTRLAAAKTGFDMGIPFNELNRLFDLGFKPLPWGDDGYLPTKYQRLNSSSPSFSSSSS